MSSKYPGIPAAAKRFWKRYILGAIAAVLSVVFLGAVAAVVVVSLMPDMIWYLQVAAVSLMAHLAAFFVRDMKQGLDPNQSSFTSMAEQLAAAVLTGSLITSQLLIASGLAMVALNFGMPTWAAVLVAAYYPIVDLVLLRQKVPTVGYFVLLAVAMCLAGIFNVHQSLVDSVPVLSRPKRPGCG